MEEMTELVHEEITAEQCAADAGFWQIYETSFPPEELEPKAAILDSCGKGGRLFRTRSGRRTVAIATTQVLPETRTLFLVYMAVEASMRGQSVGSQFLEYFFSRAAADIPGMQGMVWEVERAQDAHDSDDREKREKRIRFYERHSGRIIPYSYRQPALDGIHSIPMHIFFRSHNGASVEGYDLAKEIYFGKYGKVTGVSRGHLEDLLAGKEKLRPAFPER
ncbi:MAG: hypothetical protein ACRCUT_14990 [Spirochaetota bacterium]